MTTGNTPRNQGLNPQPRSRTTGRTAYNKSIDILRNQIDAFKKKEGIEFSKDKGKYLGILLASSAPMTIDEFKEYYPKSEHFYSEVLQRSGKRLEPAIDGYFLECYVHIPEITSMLPLPDMNVIYEYNKKYQLSTSQGNDRAEDDFKELTESYTALKGELALITMFPKFYKYSEKGDIYSPGTFVTVRYPASFPTLGIGVLEEIHKGTYKP